MALLAEDQHNTQYTLFLPARKMVSLHFRLYQNKTKRTVSNAAKQTLFVILAVNPYQSLPAIPAATPGC
jgi:hypothetical protein